MINFFRSMRQNNPMIVQNKVRMRPTKAIRASFDQPEGIFEYKVMVVILGFVKHRVLG